MNYRLAGVEYRNNDIITTETMQVTILQDLATQNDSGAYKMVKYYANVQYEELGYVNLDFIMDMTGADFLVIMMILYEEDYYPIPMDGTKWVKE